MSGYAYIYPDGHGLGKLIVSKEGRNLKTIRMFYFSHQGALRTSVVWDRPEEPLSQELLFANSDCGTQTTKHYSINDVAFCAVQGHNLSVVPEHPYKIHIWGDMSAVPASGEMERTNPLEITGELA